MDPWEKFQRKNTPLEEVKVKHQMTSSGKHRSKCFERLIGIHVPVTMYSSTWWCFCWEGDIPN